jgi:hypothetical protein
MPTAAEVDRFKSKLNVNPTGCVLWSAAKNNYGYGVFRRQALGQRGQLVLAHRFYYTEVLGLTIPVGTELDHLCNVRSCVSHTEPVTHQENCQRAARRRKSA